jgi:hypothetical protein
MNEEKKKRFILVLVLNFQPFLNKKVLTDLIKNTKK